MEHDTQRIKTRSTRRQSQREPARAAQQREPARDCARALRLFRSLAADEQRLALRVLSRLAHR